MIETARPHPPQRQAPAEPRHVPALDRRGCRWVRSSFSAVAQLGLAILDDHADGLAVVPEGSAVVDLLGGLVGRRDAGVAGGL
jgi:hypothetical protein